MSGKRVLEVVDLRAGYGDVEILKSINIRVNKREIVAIFGSNGSGKSTFLKVVAGLLRREKALFGHERGGKPPSGRLDKKG